MSFKNGTKVDWAYGNGGRSNWDDFVTRDYSYPWKESRHAVRHYSTAFDGYVDSGGDFYVYNGTVFASEEHRIQLQRCHPWIATGSSEWVWDEEEYVRCSSYSSSPPVVSLILGDE